MLSSTMPSQPEQHLLTVSGLRIAFRQGDAGVTAVQDASFAIKPGEMLALVGESGSGKSITALSLLGLLPPNAVVEAGQAHFQGRDVLALPASERRAIAGRRIAMIFQEPMTALNPVLTVGWQIGEVLKQHHRLPRAERQRRVVDLLTQVGIPDPEQRASDYPHQLSGGMRQRVMIAMALAGQPELLIADEPTTALDVTVQAQIMDLLQTLRRQYGTAILLITHNLALVNEQADRVAVMYAGSIVETAGCDDLFQRPAHPYTRLLLRSIPSVDQRGQRLAAITGSVPKPEEEIPGCRFAPRCPLATPQCQTAAPLFRDLAPNHGVACHLADTPLPEAQADAAVSKDDAPPPTPVLQVTGLRVWFPRQSGLFRRTVGYVKAVDGIDFTLWPGETLALVGESGCGKTTAGKALVGLAPINAGSIVVHGKTDLNGLHPRALRPFRQTIQMIFQDPFSSLDPRLTIGETIAEGMEIHQPGLTSNERQTRMTDLIAKVGLPADALRRYPHQFSGGQRQRIGLARSLAVNPAVVICDECTSALDVSVQAQILNLLKDLQHELGLAYLFITHDLGVVSFLAERIAVMYLGRIVEHGQTAEVMTSPRHPYTKALLAAAPTLDSADGRPKLRLPGDVPSPINPPTGCHFHPRCACAQEVCRTTPPPSVSFSPTHSCTCHFPVD